MHTHRCSTLAFHTQAISGEWYCILQSFSFIAWRAYDAYTCAAGVRLYLAHNHEKSLLLFRRKGSWAKEKGNSGKGKQIFGSKNFGKGERNCGWKKLEFWEKGKATFWDSMHHLFFLETLERCHQSLRHFLVGSRSERRDTVAVWKL